jgi:hypothetical protein
MQARALACSETPALGTLLLALPTHRHLSRGVGSVTAMRMRATAAVSCPDAPVRAVIRGRAAAAPVPIGAEPRATPPPPVYLLQCGIRPVISHPPQKHPIQARTRPPATSTPPPLHKRPARTHQHLTAQPATPAPPPRAQESCKSQQLGPHPHPISDSGLHPSRMFGTRTRTVGFNALTASAPVPTVTRVNGAPCSGIPPPSTSPPSPVVCTRALEFVNLIYSRNTFSIRGEFRPDFDAIRLSATNFGTLPAEGVTPRPLFLPPALPATHRAPTKSSVPLRS